MLLTISGNISEVIPSVAPPAFRLIPAMAASPAIPPDVPPPVLLSGAILIVVTYVFGMLNPITSPATAPIAAYFTMRMRASHTVRSNASKSISFSLSVPDTGRS